MQTSVKASTPKLTPKVRGILDKFSKSRTEPACLVERSKIILLASEHMPNKDIAGKLGIHYNTPPKWCNRFVAAIPRLTVLEQKEPENLEDEVRQVLRDAPRAGAPLSYDVNTRALIVALSCQKPTHHGFELTHWNLPTLRLAVINKGIVDDISCATLSRILREGEVQPHRYKIWLHSPDKTDDPETFRKKIQDINEVYAESHESHKQAAAGEEQHTCYYSVDEMTGLQALLHKWPDKDPAPGMVATQDEEYVRNGTLALIGALNVADGTIADPYINATRTEEDFVEAMRQLISTNPTNNWKIVSDNLNIHQSASLVEFIAGEIGYEGDLGKKGRYGILKTQASRAEFLSDKTHRIYFLYTPRHCSWMNQIEIFFGILKKQLIKRRSSISLEDLAEAIRRYVKQYNLYFAHPFKWKYNKTPLDA